MAGCEGLTRARAPPDQTHSWSLTTALPERGRAVPTASWAEAVQGARDPSPGVPLPHSKGRCHSGARQCSGCCSPSASTSPRPWQASPCALRPSPKGMHRHADTEHSIPAPGGGRRSPPRALARRSPAPPGRAPVGRGLAPSTVGAAWPDGKTAGGKEGRRPARESSALLLSPARLLLRESCQGEWSGHLISPYKFN